MDAISLLKDDHRTVEKLFKRFEKTGDRALVERRRIVDEIIKELSVHAEIEETVFYPAIREAVPRTEDMVLESLEEHHVAKWVLSELDGMPPDAERFEAKVTVLMENIRHHVEEEESDLFPKVRKAMSRTALNDMGEAMERAKAIAPTHPHPRSPDTPPGNIVTGVVAAALDRARDAGQELVEGAAGVVRRAANGPTSRPAKRTSRSAGTRKSSAKKASAKKASARKSSAKKAAGGAKRAARATAKKASGGAKKASSTAKRTGRATAKKASGGAKKASSTAKRTGRTTAKKASGGAKKASSTAKRTGRTTAKKAAGGARKASGTARKARSSGKQAGRPTAAPARITTRATGRPVKSATGTTRRATGRPARTAPGTTTTTVVRTTSRPRKVAKRS